MSEQDLKNCEKVRASFEGREAIYIEKGVLRVRVFDIRYNVDHRWISANVEEILTVGLEREHSLLHRGTQNRPSPIHWSIEAGYLSNFSENSWHAGYGGWSVYFGAEMVRGVVVMAANWPAEMSKLERYTKAVTFLQDPDNPETYERHERVFQDEGGEGPRFLHGRSLGG